MQEHRSRRTKQNAEKRLRFGAKEKERREHRSRPSTPSTEKRLRGGAQEIITKKKQEPRSRQTKQK